MLTKTLTVDQTAKWCRRDQVGWYFREEERKEMTHDAAQQSDALVHCEIRGHDNQCLTQWEVEVEQPEQPDETKPALA